MGITNGFTSFDLTWDSTKHTMVADTQKLTMIVPMLCVFIALAESV
jgi:hypothetical protein